MKTLIKELSNKNFSVYVSGEFERRTDFLGLMRLFANYSDYLGYTNREQKAMLKKWLKIKEIYIDATISVKITN